MLPTYHQKTSLSPFLFTLFFTIGNFTPCRLVEGNVSRSSFAAVVTSVCLQLCATLWTAASQAPLSTDSLGKSTWVCLPSEDIPKPRTEPRSPALQAESLPLSAKAESLPFPPGEAPFSSFRSPHLKTLTQKVYLTRDLKV